jgi:hypothetical protein
LNPIWTTLAVIAAVYGIMWSCHALFTYTELEERMKHWFYASVSFAAAMTCLVFAL